MTPENSTENPDGSELNFMGAIEAHVRWKVRLEAYISGTGEDHLDPDVVCLDDQCLLGKWIYGGGGAKYGSHPLFPDLKQTHMQFHRAAGDIIRTVDAGDREKARTMLNSGDYARHSYRIKSELARLSLELESNIE